MTAHDHREYVEGCFRCDLSRAETAPDAAGIEAALAAGLAAHEGWDYGGPGVIECEGCGWKSERLGPEWNSRKGDRHRAHVAAALLPVVTQAQAEALREFVRWVASNRAYNGSDHQHAQSLYNECLNGVLPTWAEDWLRARADESGA